MSKRSTESPQKECPKRKKIKKNTPSINLNYPYKSSAAESSSAGINPPFLDPNGPLFDNGDQLVINTKAPISILNRAIGIKTDNTLSINDNDQLSVNVDCEGPLEITESGLNLKYDESLRVDDDWELGINVPQDQPFEIARNGLNIRLDDTLLIDRDESTGKYELGVSLNHSGPITADSEGIDLEYDTSTLKVQNIQGNNALGVKLKDNNPISRDRDGIFLLYNTNDFQDDNTHGLSLKYSMQYLSPYSWYEAGNADLVSGTMYIRTSGTTNWSTAYHLLLANSCGLINGMMHLRLDRSKFYNAGQQTELNKVQFTLVINVSGKGYNPSNMTAGTAHPVNSMLETFNPNPRATQLSQVVFPVGRDWYEPAAGNGTQFTFVPKGLNGAGFGTSMWSFWVAKAKDDTNYVIVMSFDLSKTAGDTWFQPGYIQGIMDSGELYFNYQGSMPLLN